MNTNMEKSVNTLTSQEEMESSPISIIPTEMLQNILQLLPLRDLLKCREVSHRWKSAATLPARKKCCRIPFSAKINMHDRIQVLRDFNESVSAAEGEFPVSKFHFTWNSTDRWIEINGPENCVAAFFRKVNQFISELSMDFCLGGNEVPMDALVISQQQPRYEKLKCLRLKILSDRDYNGARRKKLMSVPNTDDNSIFTFVRSLIANAPNLDNVKLKLGLDIKQRNVIPRCVDEFGIREKLKILTSLKICAFFENVDWETLTSMGLKLKIFHITFGHCSFESSVLKAFLESQANTLRELEICYDLLYDHAISMEFPRLPQLIKLKIAEKYYLESQPKTRRLNFPTLSYQNQLPALKELCLTEAKTQLQNFFSTNLAPLESLEKISLPKTWFDKYGIEFLQIVRTFPNIKKLQLNHEDENRLHDHMKVIFENMTALEELCIRVPMKCYDYDCIITGFLPWKSFNRAIDLPTKTMACLENLKVLRILRSQKLWPLNLEITELSGNVLKKMKSLECVDFGVRKCPPIMIALKDDLEKHGIKFILRRPSHRRSKLGLTPVGYTSVAVTDSDSADEDDDNVYSGPDSEDDDEVELGDK